MPTPDDLPADLQDLLDDVTAEIDGLSARIEAGDISVDEWQAEMEQIITDRMDKALATGAGEYVEAADLLGRLIDIQIEFLGVFAVEVAANGWLPAYTSRATMYGDSIKAAFWNGDIYRQAGRFLPLPAMPAEGTQCLTRCKCSWRTDVINEGRGDYDCYWIRGARDSCQTCIQRELEWSPLQIRGGRLI